MLSFLAVTFRFLLLAALLLPVLPAFAQDGELEEAAALEEDAKDVGADELADVENAASLDADAIYKCKDERGRVSYTEKPCDEKAEAMHDLPAVNQQPPVTVTEHYRAAPPVETYQEKNSVQRNGSFQCDGRTRCSQMTSCEEAKFFLAHCPDVKMDGRGKGDGIPCESQWCNADGE